MIDAAGPGALDELAVLVEPVRRRLYLHVLDADQPVSRDAAAAAAGIGRALAAFHLDRLVEAGLLDTEYRRLTSRRGPGAGRPSKLYRPSKREITAAIPPRHYEVAADVFATALESMPSTVATVAEVASREGRALGTEARRRAGGRSGRPARLDAVSSVLRDAGYGPTVVGDELRLRNCPFRAISDRHRTVTCGMNLALIEGVLEAAGLPPAAARLDIQPERCCVAIDANLARAPEARP